MVPSNDPVDLGSFTFPSLLVSFFFGKGNGCIFIFSFGQTLNSFLFLDSMMRILGDFLAGALVGIGSEGSAKVRRKFLSRHAGILASFISGFRLQILSVVV